VSLLDELHSFRHEVLKWNCKTQIFESKCENGLVIPDQDRKLIFEEHGNLVMYGGVSALWEMAMGNGTTTADQALTYFNNTRAAIGVGDGSAAAVATQNNLQGANKLRKGMNATFPQHTDGLVAGSINWIFESTFGAAEANFAGGWQEWGIFNSATDGNGRMLNRKVVNMGTKSAAVAWDLRLTLSIS
jgi:hypothetical protein